MFKRIIHWKAYRKMNQMAEQHNWKDALEIAKQVGDEECRKIFALCLCVQLLDESFGDK